jgi:hypothetical protein
MRRTGRIGKKQHFFTGMQPVLKTDFWTRFY